MPAPKAPVYGLMHWGNIKPRKVQCDPFFEHRKAVLPPLSKERENELRTQICEAIQFYSTQKELSRQAETTTVIKTASELNGLQKNEQLKIEEVVNPLSFEIPTPYIVTGTARGNAIRRLTQAAEFLKMSTTKGDDVYKIANRVERAYHQLDFGTKLILRKQMKLDNSIVAKMLNDFRFKDSLPIPPDSILLLNNIAALNPKPDVRPKPQSDPYLYNLITILAPIWKEATGRTIKRTNCSGKVGEVSSDGKRYLFAETIRQILASYCIKYPPSIQQVYKICKEIN